MLDVYRLYKSIELHLIGDYDYLKYKRLKNLTEDSFQKESGDFKLLVRGLTFSHKDAVTTLKMSLKIASLFFLNSDSRDATLKKLVYGGMGLDCQPIDSSLYPNAILHDLEMLVISKHNEVVEWINSSDTINLDFFSNAK